MAGRTPEPELHARPEDATPEPALEPPAPNPTLPTPAAPIPPNSPTAPALPEEDATAKAAEESERDPESCAHSGSPAIPLGSPSAATHAQTPTARP